jgi:hypothetical protein
VRDGTLKLFQLEPRRTFWDVLADETGVWLVGEDRALVHFDGHRQIRWVAKALRRPLTGLARDGQGRLWIVGPSTLFRATPW